MRKNFFSLFFKLNFVPTYHRRFKATHLFQCKMVFNTSLWMYRISFLGLIFRFIFSIGSGSKFLVLYARVDRKRCYFLHWNSSDVTTWHYINYVGYVAIALQLDIPQIIYYFPILLRRLFLAKKRVENIRCILIRWLLEN